ncbi:hypothetical protein [Aeromonas caviae]|uniref:hypothetical protein n=1 Tax=Aeromonas caviae TaxID=648 RepID=UPI002B472769|nr:hypothetical protein [Aeromonas caviae]
MTIEHMPDGTKQFTDAQGVVTKHADMSAVFHFQQTGLRLAYDAPEGYKAPEPGQGSASGQGAQGDKNAVDLYVDRCRNQGVARARRAVGLE